jgi:ribosome recycling factor
MSESKANGPASEQGASGLPNARTQLDLQAECDRLRVQVQQLTEERDRLQKSVAALTADYKESLRSLFDYLKRQYGEEPPWPEDENECAGFGQVLEELEKEFKDLKHAEQS